MRKFAFIILLVLSVSSFAQRTELTDSIQVTEITGSDTIINFLFYSKVPVSILFEITTLNADDATLEVFYSDSEYRLTSVNPTGTTIYPLTLEKAASTYIEAVTWDGATKYYHRVVKSNWNCGMAFRLTVSSATTGALKWTITK